MTEESKRFFLKKEARTFIQTLFRRLALTINQSAPAG